MKAPTAPDLTAFWVAARKQLFAEYGQAGRRNRQRMAERQELATELGLRDVTVRAFLNGSQKSLGEFSRGRLCSKYPAIGRMYEEACQLVEHAKPAKPGASEKQEASEPVQIMLEFEGFETKLAPVIVRIQPGRDGFVTVRVKQRAV